MGTCDNVTVDYPLPHAEAQDIHFQTRGLNKRQETYRITKKGYLMRKLEAPSRWESVAYYGDLFVYGYNLKGKYYEYMFRIIEGRVQCVYHVPDD